MQPLDDDDGKKFSRFFMSFSLNVSNPNSHSDPEAYLEPCQKSMMELFGKILIVF